MGQMHCVNCGAPYDADERLETCIVCDQPVAERVPETPEVLAA